MVVLSLDNCINKYSIEKMQHILFTIVHSMYVVISEPFFFVHFKKTDSYGEDGNFDAKVAVIEEVDKWVQNLEGLNEFKSTIFVSPS